VKIGVTFLMDADGTSACARRISRPGASSVIRVQLVAVSTLSDA
jgi:hypothetical protein